MTYGRREPDRPAEKNWEIGLRVPGAPPASAVVSGTVTARPGAYCTADRLAEALFAPPKVMLPRTLMRYSSRPGWSKA